MSNIQIDANNRITIKGAREHNLKNVNLVLPRNKHFHTASPEGAAV